MNATSPVPKAPSDRPVTTPPGEIPNACESTWSRSATPRSTIVLGGRPGVDEDGAAPGDQGDAWGSRHGVLRVNADAKSVWILDGG